jgi:uncharacterized protein (PEP-CTERM system associated)
VALAQGAGVSSGARAQSVETYGSATETVTDNYLLSSVAPSSDSITRLTAGVRLGSNSGQWRGFVDYALSSLLYARHSDSNTHQNTLNADISADLIEGRAKVDVTATIAQSAISAFGAQPSNGLPIANSTELRTLRVTPSFMGPLGPNFRYTALLGYSVSESADTQAGDSRYTSASVHIEQVSTARLAWSVDGQHSGSDYSGGRATTDDRLLAALSLMLTDLDLKVHANGGIELSDIGALSRQRTRTWGVGGTWAPSPRAQLTAQWDDRFFGHSYSVAAEYRTPLTVFRFSDSRSLSGDNGQAGVGSRGRAFDLYFAQFASIEPDPVKRADLVNSYLRSKSIDPTTGQVPSFLRSAVTVDDRQDFSVAWRGVRDSAMLTLSRSRTQQLDSAVAAADDLAQSNAVWLSGLSVNLSHQLTPASALTLTLRDSHGYGVQSSQDSRQRQLELQHSTALARSASLNVGFRRGLYTTSQSPYSETALFASFGTRF